MSNPKPADMTGLEVLQRISDGRIPHPSMAHTLGFRLTEVEYGRAVISGETGPDYCNPSGTIHSAWHTALLDSCMGSAVNSMLPAGASSTTLEFKIDFIRTVTTTTGKVTAVGTVTKVGKQIGVAEGVLCDSAGQVLARGTTTCLVLRPQSD